MKLENIKAKKYQLSESVLYKKNTRPPASLAELNQITKLKFFKKEL
jgi:hypothetical protein